MKLEILYVCENEYKPITDIFCQSNTHVHDHIELSIILSGEAQYIINGKSYVMKAGEMVLFNPGVSHSVQILPQANYRDLHIGINCVLTDFEIDNEVFNDGFAIINYQDERKKILEVCKNLGYETTHCKLESKLMIEALVMQLFILLSRLLTTETNYQTEHTTSLGYPDKKKVVDFITTYINENYMNEVSLEMFAKDMYLSQVYISKIFKEETGHSPIHFLIKKRLSTAKKLLETENLPIKIISSKVGYEDAYHFSKLFKKYYGFPPSQIKQKK